MGYLLTIIIYIILWYLAYKMSGKYNKKVGRWSKEKIPLVYALCMCVIFLYIFIAPAVMTYEILDGLNIDITYIMLLSIMISTISMVIFINKMPTKKESEQ